MKTVPDPFFLQAFPSGDVDVPRDTLPPVCHSNGIPLRTVGTTGGAGVSSSMMPFNSVIAAWTIAGFTRIAP